MEEYPLTEPWPDDPLLGPNFYGQGIYEAPDGTLVVFLHGSLAESHEHDLFTWGSYKAQVYSIRSTDGGKTWSAPVNVDGVRKQGGERGVLPGCLDLIEPVASFTADGRLLAYCRPIYSPTMWQATSTDAAQTWDAVAIGPFPGYSAGMICTSSGALLVAHRFPNTTIHTSLDGGRSWDAGTAWIGRCGRAASLSRWPRTWCCSSTGTIISGSCAASSYASRSTAWSRCRATGGRKRAD